MILVCGVLALVAVNGIHLEDSSLELNEVAWLSEPNEVYLGSPSVVFVPGSPESILVGSDRFGTGFDGQPRNVSIYESKDSGETWSFKSWCLNQYWSNLFAVDSDIYMLGTSTDSHEAGVHISKSTDGGATWTGSLLIPAGSNYSYATGPTPTVEFQGRYYRAIERWISPWRWGVDFQASAVSAPKGADLMDPSVWVETTPLAFDASWIPFNVTTPAFLEGNMVIGRNNTLFNILRTETAPNYGNYAIMLALDPATQTFSFHKLINLPGGHTKFTIRYDPVSDLYVSFTNINLDISFGDQRNVLVLVSSKDLISWNVLGTLLSDDTGFEYADSVRYTGFSYVDYQFDEGDLFYAIRTAYRTPNSYHNSDRMTTKRLSQWRNLLNSTAAHVNVQGSSFVASPFENGSLAFTDRDYVWIHIPTTLFPSSSSFSFAKIAGGAPDGAKPNVTFTVQKTGYCFAAFDTGDATAFLNATQWDWIAPSSVYLQYNDTNLSKLPIARKICASGETHVVPQASWAGGILIYPSN